MPYTNWTFTILPSILGFLAGVIGSLIAPWVKWGIEKRRMKFQNHRELVSNWRVLLNDVSEVKARKFGGTRLPTFIDRVQGHQYFPSLQPHLSKETLDLLISLHTPAKSHHMITSAYESIVKDVNEAERKWDLL